MFWMTALRLLPILAIKLPAILADGKISAKESASLLIDLAGALGIPMDIDVSEFTGALPPKGATPLAPTMPTD